MIIEHLFYNTAISLIAGTILARKQVDGASLYPWIILLSAYVPDLTAIIRSVENLLELNIPFLATIPQKDGFHTIGALVCYMVLIGLLSYLLNLRFNISFLFAGIGYGAHLFADALAYPRGYELLWPLSSDNVGIGIFDPYTPDIFGIAESTPLAIGIVLFVLSFLIHTYFTPRRAERTG
ncbi:MAG: metal-dependent hydrolase [Methanomicrobiales archaeon]|nr:metal-dependent hydrolase [Methanomicrobiales archaeon]